MENVLAVEGRLMQLLVKYVDAKKVISVASCPKGEQVLKNLALVSEFKGINPKVIPTSFATAKLINDLGFEKGSMNDDEIDVGIDFVDSVDLSFNYVKETSNSLVRDKMIAMSSLELIIVAKERNYSQKLSRKIPMEVVEFGLKKTMLHLEGLGDVELIKEKEKPLRTETGNFLVQVDIDPIFSMEDIEFQSKNIPGVIETGLFMGYADRVILEGKKTFTVKSRIQAEESTQVIK